MSKHPPAYTVIPGLVGFWVVPVRRFWRWYWPASKLEGHYCEELDEAKKLAGEMNDMALSSGAGRSDP
jgi:hypothetical protein